MEGMSGRSNNNKYWQDRFDNLTDELEVIKSNLGYFFGDRFEKVISQDSLEEVWQALFTQFLSGNLKEHVWFLDKYEKKLTEFYNEVNGEEFESLRRGYEMVTEVSFKIAREFIGEYANVEDKSKLQLGGSYKTKMRDNFLEGIELFFKNVHKAIAESKTIDDKRLRKYILNQNIGLGKYYRYNKSNSDYASYNRIQKLNRKELKKVFNLLEKRPDVKERSINSWIDLGTKKDPVRILLHGKKGDRENVYYIFRNNNTEKEDYKRVLGMDARRVDFEAA